MSDQEKRGALAAFCMAIGALIMTLSGLCTGTFVLKNLSNARLTDLLSFGALFGGVPFAIGLLAFVLAYRSGKRS